MNELDFIDWLRQQGTVSPFVTVAPGDDAAVLRGTGADLLATTDMLLDGVEFVLCDAGPRRVGRKAMAANLSDIAAMAGKPIAALVSVGLPGRALAVSGPDTPMELYRGMRQIADEFDTPIVGGDTNSWDGPLAISVTLLGEVTGRGPVLRSGAQPGDWLFVTGPLGGSILGKHLDFTPRVREAQALHNQCDLHAMIDISDGLALDLSRTCKESNCGAVLNADRIPIADDARRMADDKTPLDHALGDGEDFELLFAVSVEDGQRLLRTQPIEGITLAHIGECVDDGLWLERGGKREALAPAGYVHDLG